VINQLWQSLSRRIPLRLPPRLGGMLGITLTFLGVVFAWVYFRAPDLATANRLVIGMVGGWGAALPEPILSHLGPLKALFESLGIGSYLGGGATFVETWCWITVGALIAFVAPNTQEIMGRFEPALPEEGRDRMRPAQRLAWAPQRRNAMAMGLLFALGVLALSRPTEFLYFQF
jgi:alginate O-acetyltransferase complex protein AlgI